MKKLRPLCFHNFMSRPGIRKKKFKMAAKKFQNEFQGVKKFHIKKLRPLCFHNFMSRLGINKTKFKMAAKKFKMAAKKF